MRGEIYCTERFIKELQEVNLYERSEILRILHAIREFGVSEPEMLVPIQDGNEVLKVEDNHFKIRYKSNEKKLILLLEELSDSEFKMKSLTLKE